MSIFKKEPAAIIGALMALVALAVTFGLPISTEQQEAFESALWLILPLILAGTVATRQSVYAPANVVAVKGKEVGGGPDVEAVAGPAHPLPDGAPVIVTSDPPA